MQHRVLPRDLFNEGDLLKCYGRLWILLDQTKNHRAKFDQEDVPFFEIKERGEDGWTFIENITLSVGDRRFYLTRPLNARWPWPLIIEEIDNEDFEPFRVFTEEGKLSEDMLALIRS